MSKRAWAYVLGIIGSGSILTILAFASIDAVSWDWTMFGILLALATVAQGLKVPAPNHQLYHPNAIFLFASSLLLPSYLFIGVVIGSMSIEWIKERLHHSRHLRKWYLQPFNMSSHILAGTLSFQIVLAMNSLNQQMGISTLALTGLLSAAIYTIINHLTVGLALVIARGVSLRESGILDIENLMLDYVGLCLGFVVSVLWKYDFLLLLPALAPLLIIYRALAIPGLKKEAQTDGKTGLLNAHYFGKLYMAETERALNHQHPLSMIMADLDLLRNINNTYGHLAGDAVLAGVAKIMREHIRKYDIAGRFGGEEFCVALPETPLEEAREIAERIRMAIATAGFKTTEDSAPINATMSFGVACLPQDATTANALIHQADLAVYQAKLQGRNRVVAASEVPHSIKLEMPMAENRLDSSLTAVYSPPPIKIETKISHDTADLSEQRTQSKSIAPVHYPDLLLAWIVGAVILVAVIATLVGFSLEPSFDMRLVILLTVLAAITQLPQVKNVYGETSMSVAVAIVFTAAILADIAGLVFTSLTIVLAHRAFRWQANKRWGPIIYKTAYNWAVHVLAGLAPVIAFNWMPAPLAIEHLPTSILAVILVAVVYYFVETSLLTAAISVEKQLAPIATWREQFKWLLPHYIALCLMGFFLCVSYTTQGWLGILVFTVPVLMMYYAQRQYVERSEKGAQELRRMNQELSAANREVLDASQTIRELNEELLVAFAKMIDARDPYVSGHSAKVADYAAALATTMNLPTDMLKRVRQAGFLHDIGKIGISEQVLHKPARLDFEEYAYIKTHSLIGAQFLETCKGLRDLVPGVKHHHEWWNGNGYPDSLRGEAIPIEARILAVCDAVEVMASDRPYHSAMPISAITQELERCAGVQFDPQVVHAFLRLVAQEKTALIVNSAHTVTEKKFEQPLPTRFHDQYNLALKLGGCPITAE